MAEQPKSTLVNQVDTVLQDYLDQLLEAATAPVPVVTPAQTELATDIDVPVPVATDVAAVRPRVQTFTTAKASDTHTSVMTQVMEAVAVPAPVLELPLAEPEPELEPEPEPEWVAEDSPEPVAVSVTEVAQVDETDVNLSSDYAGGSEPPQTMSLNWRSSQGIDCLIFKIAGLKLAIPLPLLGGVHNVTDKVTPLFGQAAWSLGIWQGEAGKLTIIDSAQLIMPERGIRLADEGYQFFIQLDRSPWALACQEICDTVTLVHDSIKWRGDGSKRPWLAGTVITEMCALLDVPGLMKLLSDNSRVRARPSA
ncbi:chemotaxis protein CheW [Thalassolituus sp. LLYu03]|uniref:chemotaxis protein CheW n=1 Tax=Thalassolituus sp. LLYu03 TaxID=3421656 RepID=UPI003D2C87F1